MNRANEESRISNVLSRRLNQPASLPTPGHPHGGLGGALPRERCSEGSVAGRGPAPQPADKCRSGRAPRHAGGVTFASACCSTPALVGGGSRAGLADVVAGGALPVLASRWAPGSWMAGFRCAGGLGDLRPEVAKPA